MNHRLIELQVAQHDFWLDNLEQLHTFIEGLKDENLDLDSFNGNGTKSNGQPKKPKIEHTCSSIACIGGWVAVMPHFKDIGIRRDKDHGGPIYELDNSTLDPVDAASFFLFGVNDMFEARDDDKEGEGTKHEDKTDREIALRRIKKRIKAIQKKQEALYD